MCARSLVTSSQVCAVHASHAYSGCHAESLTCSCMLGLLITAKSVCCIMLRCVSIVLLQPVLTCLLRLSLLQLHLDLIITASCMNLHPLMPDGAVPMLKPQVQTQSVAPHDSCQQRLCGGLQAKAKARRSPRRKQPTSTQCLPLWTRMATLRMATLGQMMPSQRPWQMVCMLMMMTKMLQLLARKRRRAANPSEVS